MLLIGMKDIVLNVVVETTRRVVSTGLAAPLDEESAGVVVLTRSQRALTSPALCRAPYDPCLCRAISLSIALIEICFVGSLFPGAVFDSPPLADRSGSLRLTLNRAYLDFQPAFLFIFTRFLGFRMPCVAFRGQGFSPFISTILKEIPW